MATHPRIVVGISGGVDSAVAALRLLREGYAVEGLHMTNWDEADAYCSAADDLQSARQVCTELGIPLHRANFSQAYRDEVFSHFLREYEAGRTPNPDVLCNRTIKFGRFSDYAQRLGAGLIATGHYARLAAGDPPRLCKAADADKDQTYFLHAVDPRVFARVRFPLGDLLKAEVRALATAAGLPNHDRPDSTGICFIGERPFREFLSRYLPARPGPMETPEGEHVGHHAGLACYTPGQRSGLGIGGHRSSGEPWYVAGKDTARNALIVVQGREHPLLWSTTLRSAAMHWLRGRAPEPQRGDSFPCSARIRHRHPAAACEVRPLQAGSFEITFRERQWAAAPGQYVVLYDGDECLGGGVIESTLSGAAATPARHAHVA